MKKEIKFDRVSLLFLEDLADILLAEEYFSFTETADSYIDDLVGFIVRNIDDYPHKTAPTFLLNTAKNLFYISYSRNNRTTWYILFEKTTSHYLIRCITNNHVSGHYF